MRRKDGMLIALTVLCLTMAKVASASECAKSADDQAALRLTTGTPAQTQHWGSINPENLPPLFAQTEFRRWLAHHCIRYYGWIDGGGYYSSSGPGELQLGFPTPNRFADTLVLEAAWVTVERPLTLHAGGWDWGFRVDFFAGQGAALLRPLNSFGPQSQRMGTDFRQAFFSLHLPIFTKGGIDVQLGRQNVPIGYETIMGVYRPLYSATYYWIFHQVGSTGIFATLHASSKLDLIAGSDLNYNTVFILRGRAPSYLAKAIYTPAASKATTLIADVYTGPLPVPTLAEHNGLWQTLFETEIRHRWSQRVSQVLQGSYEWNIRDPAEMNRTSVAQGAFSIVSVHLTQKSLDLNLRGEWMHDLNGIRTHLPGTFGEATGGISIMPVSWITLRPEVRGDFASSSVLGPLNATVHRRTQLTAGGDLIFKF